MPTVEKPERDVALTEAELAEFHAAAWGRRLAVGAAAGPRGRFANEALAEHRAGRSRPI